MVSQETLQLTKTKKRRFFYGYVVVAAVFVVLLLAVGGTSSFGVYFRPFVMEFGWTRAMTLGAVSLGTILVGFVVMGAGKLSDRFGHRPMLSAGGLLLGLGYLVMSQISAIWQQYLLYGMIMAIGLASAIIPSLSVITRWFVEKRGTMTGIVMAGIGTGALCTPLLASWLFSSYGWRTSFIVMGITSLVLVVSVAQFLRHGPDQVGQLPYYGGADVKQESPNLKTRGFSFREAIHTRQLWVLWAIFFCLGFSIFTIMINITIYAAELRITTTSAFNILTVIALVNIIGSILVGGVADQVGNRPALITSLILMLVALLLLQIARPGWGSTEWEMEYLLLALPAVAGFGSAVLVLMSPMVAELFGLSSHGVLLGLIGTGLAIGAAIGSVLAGHMFDITGYHNAAFLICVILSAIGIILTILLRPVRE